MKRLSLSVLMALALTGVTAQAQDYCTYEGTVSRGDRATRTLTVTTPAREYVVSDIQRGSGSAVYHDKTSSVIMANPGDEIIVKPTATGGWMHNYLWVDYNNDGEFTPDWNTELNMLTAQSEVVDFCFYSPEDAGTGYNGKGNAVANNVNGYSYTLSFIVPDDLGEGTYRMRYIVDWCNLDACGIHADGKNALTDNGGVMVDMTLMVTKQTILPERSISLEVVGNGEGNAELLNARTLEAIENGSVMEIGSDMQIIASAAAGSFISEALIITDDETINLLDKVYDRKFSYAFTHKANTTVRINFAPINVGYTVDVEGNGTVSVKGAAGAYEAGAEIPYNTELTLTFAPGEDYYLSECKIIEGSTVYNGFDHGLTRDGGVINGWTASDNFSISAVYTAYEYYTVNVEACENGAVKVMNGDAEVASGAQVREYTQLTLVAEPAADHELVTFIVNGNETRNSSITLSEDITVSATFAEIEDYGNRAVVVPVVGEVKKYNDKAGWCRDEYYRIEIPNKAVLATAKPSTGSSFTMSSWVMFNSFPDTDGDFSQVMGHRAHIYDNANGSVLLGYNKDGQLTTRAGADNGVNGLVCTNDVLETSRWYYLTLMYDENEQLFSVYLDGEFVGSKYNNQVWKLFQDEDNIHPAVGNMFFMGGHATDLTVDQVVFYNRPLTEDELLTAMERPTTIDGLTAKYDFDKALTGTAGTFANDAEAAAEGTDCTFRKLISDGNRNEWGVSPGSCTEVKPEYVEGHFVPEYCTFEGVNTHGSRATKALSFVTSSGSEQTLSDLQETGRRSAVYMDRTDFVLRAYAGETITITPTADGEWMHAYTYIDFGRDGEFSAALNQDGTIAAGSDLVSFTRTMAPDGSWVTGNGGSVSDGHGWMKDPQTFTLPADLKPGDYRVRYKVDWDKIDACGDKSMSGNGGIMLDFILRIAKAPMRTVTVEVNDANLGKVVIAEPATEGNTVTTALNVTLNAEPAEGAVLVNWTDAEGTILSTEDTYVYSGSTDLTIKANFGFVLTLVEGDGQLVVRDGDNISYTDGSKVVAGTELTLDARAPAGKQLKTLVMNGEDVTAKMVNGQYFTFVMDAATTIEAEFGDPVYLFTVTYEGSGKGDAYVAFDEDGAGRDVENGNELPSADDVEDIYLVFVAAEGSEFVKAEIDGEEYMADDAEMFYVVEKRYVLAWGTGAEVNVTAWFNEVGHTNGIDAIGADAADAEFFNLQGVRVASDNLTPGVYLMRRGAETVKVLVK